MNCTERYECDLSLFLDEIKIFIQLETQIKFEFVFLQECRNYMYWSDNHSDELRAYFLIDLTTFGQLLLFPPADYLNRFCYILRICIHDQTDGTKKFAQ